MLCLWFYVVASLLRVKGSDAALWVWGMSACLWHDVYVWRHAETLAGLHIYSLTVLAAGCVLSHVLLAPWAFWTLKGCSGYSDSSTAAWVSEEKGREWAFHLYMRCRNDSTRFSEAAQRCLSRQVGRFTRVCPIDQAYDVTLAGKPYLSAGEQTSGRRRLSHVASDRFSAVRDNKVLKSLDRVWAPPCMFSSILENGSQCDDPLLDELWVL